MPRDSFAVRLTGQRTRRQRWRRSRRRAPNTSRITVPWRIATKTSTGTRWNFVSFRADIDATPLLKGLPDDRGQCPQLGYVIKGRMTYRFADREEVFEAGDAFDLPPGHVPVADAGSEFVQFSPSE